MILSHLIKCVTEIEDLIVGDVFDDDCYNSAAD